jgi:hypothetical protein
LQMRSIVAYECPSSIFKWIPPDERRKEWPSKPIAA